MGIWKTFLGMTIDLHGLRDIRATGATVVDRIAASQHYAKRANYTFRAVNTTALVDCETGAIPERHCSMKQPPDSQVVWEALERNLDTVSILTADNGYDWWVLRSRLRTDGVKPLIRHRECGWTRGRRKCPNR